MSESIIQALVAAESPTEQAAVIAESVFARLPDDTSTVARRCVILHWFDPEIIAALCPDTTPDPVDRERIYDQLAALPFFEKVQWGLAYHELTRTGLLKRYSNQEPDILVAGARLAAPIYAAHKAGDLAAQEALYCQIVSGATESALATLDALLAAASARKDWGAVASVFSIQDGAEALPFVQPLPRHPDHLLARRDARRAQGALGLNRLAADVTGRLVSAAGYQAKKRFRPGPQLAALNATMAEALYVTAEELADDDPDALTHYLSILGQWLARDAVVGELSLVVDPRPGVELDLALLAGEFRAARFESDWQGEGFTFEKVVGQLVQAFYDAANRQPELQGQLEIGLLRGIAENTSEQARSGVINEGNGVAFTGDHNHVITGKVSGNVEVRYGDTYELPPDPPADPTALRQAYLNRVLAQTQTLQLAGVDPKAASNPTARTGLALAAVYTALLTQQTEQAARPAAPLPERAARRLSAVALLDREPKLALLGDPGSGKSTFVNFVTLCLAGDALGRPDANVALLTTPLPQEDEQRPSRDEKPAPQPWRHGALLPVRVVLRDFAARGLPPSGQRAAGDHLWRFIAAELGDTLADYAPHLKRTLRETGGLVLLDGLDEVPEADQRRVQVKQAVQGFAADFPRCRFVVTSRTYAYQRQNWKLPGFNEAVLAPFSPAQINRFVDGWYAHLAAVRGSNQGDAQGRAALLKEAIRRSPRLTELAERPLLLTLMVSLHAWRGGNLPEKREELYADTVDLLLDQWESPKMVLGPDRQPVVAEPSLLEWLKLDRAGVRRLLERLAFEAHRDQANLTGTADIGQERLVNGLVGLTANPDVKPARVIEYVRDRAGLLVARGVGVYTFPHRVFQEYLAACYLTDYGFPDDLAELVLADGQRWREVALLAGAKVARGSVTSAWNLAEALCCHPVGGQPKSAHYLAALLAAQTLIENSVLATISERNRPKAACIQGWLRAIAERGALGPVDRAAAGDALAVFGDDRPGVGLRGDGPSTGSGQALPDIAWCAVPAGDFIMGSQDDELAWGKETPQHTLELPTYQISKYLITNAQFDAFVQDGGYTDQWRGCWTAAGWQWRGQLGGPDKYGGVYDLPNHPVVMVTWYEAHAFCNWLGQKLGLAVTLPSEAQWVKAACGPATGSGNGRTYPWGEQITPDHANYAATGIGTTTAVGIFPKGTNPCGALDMSGNAWEWCRTKWHDDYTRRPDDTPEGDSARVLRGGAFDDSARFVRCAFRNRLSPNSRFRKFGFRVVASPIIHDRVASLGDSGG